MIPFDWRGRLDQPRLARLQGHHEGNEIVNFRDAAVLRMNADPPLSKIASVLTARREHSGIFFARRKSRGAGRVAPGALGAWRLRGRNEWPYGQLLSYLATPPDF